MSNVLPVEDSAKHLPKPPTATTAGGLLRQARQAQGLHIATLAASIKVASRKLELLEADQYDQLPDATFTRGLAHAVCRSLKIDSVPVLAMLPPLNEHRLEEVAEGLNMPFNERPGRLVPKEWLSVSSPAMWLAALLVIGAVFVYVMPAGWLAASRGGLSRAASDAGTVSAPVAEPVPPGAEPAIAETPPLPASAAAPISAGLLQFRVSGQSWVDVTDANGKPLIGRLLKSGESVSLDGVTPFKVTIGNAASTQLVFRGQPQELTRFTRDNVARLELK